MKHVMLAVGGETPQIITEAVYALKEQMGIELAEVQVLTTRRGREIIRQSLLDPDEGHFRELCREYQLSTRFAAEMIHVFTDPSGQLLDDVRTSEENGCVRDQVFDKVRELTEEIDLCLHGCIAGGRKSMSFFLGAAFNFFRRLPREGHPGDRLYHVLVSPSEVERAKDFFFIPREAREYDRRVVGFTEEAMPLLMNYSWPGNVRELRNDLEKLVIDTRSGAVRLRAEELSPKFHEGRHSTPAMEQLLSLPAEQSARGFLRLRILKALEASGCRMQEAAEELGRTRQWLNKQIRELDLQGEVDALKEKN